MMEIVLYVLTVLMYAVSALSIYMQAQYNNSFEKQLDGYRGRQATYVPAIKWSFIIGSFFLVLAIFGF